MCFSTHLLTFRRRDLDSGMGVGIVRVGVWVGVVRVVVVVEVVEVHHIRGGEGRTIVAQRRSKG